jgi:hypothetical protein
MEDMSETPKPPPVEKCADCGTPLRKGPYGNLRYWCVIRGYNKEGWPLSAKICPACAALERSRIDAAPLPAWAKEEA